jgi:hypothetical protein
MLSISLQTTQVVATLLTVHAENQLQDQLWCFEHEVLYKHENIRKKNLKNHPVTHTENECQGEK